MKICIVAPFDYPIPAIKGGALEQIVESICRINEVEEKLDITVLATYEESLKEIDFHCTKFHYFKKSVMDKASFFAFRVIKKLFKIYIPSYPRMIKVRRWLEKYENQYDFIVYEDGPTYMLAYLFKNIDRRKVISHLHWVGDPDNKSNRYFAHLIPVSKYVGDVWLKGCSVPKIETHFVRNGVDLDKFKKQLNNHEKISLKSELRIRDDDFVILFIGRITWEKGIAELIHAIELIDDKRMVLLLVGAPQFAVSAQSKYQIEIDRLIKKASHKIICTGYVKNDEIYKYQNIADIAVIPTIIEEAAPLVCVENMAAGLPLIITDSGGMPEYTNPRCSIVVKKGDGLEKRLAESIRALMKDADRRIEMGTIAKQIAEEYTIKRMYEEFVSCLDSIKNERLN